MGQHNMGRSDSYARGGRRWLGLAASAAAQWCLVAVRACRTAAAAIELPRWTCSAGGRRRGRWPRRRLLLRRVRHFQAIFQGENVALGLWRRRCLLLGVAGASRRRPGRLPAAVPAALVSNAPRRSMARYPVAAFGGLPGSGLDQGAAGQPPLGVRLEVVMARSKALADATANRLDRVRAILDASAGLRPACARVLLHHLGSDRLDANVNESAHALSRVLERQLPIEALRQELIGMQRGPAQHVISGYAVPVVDAEREFILARQVRHLRREIPLRADVLLDHVRLEYLVGTASNLADAVRIG
mmetsp:Transcript_104624/g.295988  ORF Transcript_104624/g.295988 Transcript_104624/m.295988 type:complete len:302 (+) Transcript_104624:28-933(+)